MLYYSFPIATYLILFIYISLWTFMDISGVGIGRTIVDASRHDTHFLMPNFKIQWHYTVHPREPLSSTLSSCSSQVSTFQAKIVLIVLDSYTVVFMIHGRGYGHGFTNSKIFYLWKLRMSYINTKYHLVLLKLYLAIRWLITGRWTKSQNSK